jgi:hypothetical protein
MDFPHRENHFPRLKLPIPGLENLFPSLEIQFPRPENLSQHRENHFPSRENPPQDRENVLPHRENFFPRLKNPFPRRENVFPGQKTDCQGPEKRCNRLINEGLCEEAGNTTRFARINAHSPLHGRPIRNRTNYFKLFLGGADELNNEGTKQRSRTIFVPWLLCC